MHTGNDAGIGQRAVHPRVLSTLLLCGLLGCSTSPDLSIDNLRLPLTSIPGATRLEIKSEGDAVAAGAEESLATQAMRSQHLAQTSYFKYHLGGDPGGAYKVKLSIYTEPAHQRAAWARKYPAAGLVGTQPRDWGEAGFLIPGRIGAFGLGRVTVQVEGGGQAPDLEAVLAAFAARAAALSP